MRLAPYDGRSLFSFTLSMPRFGHCTYKRVSLFPILGHIYGLCKSTLHYDNVRSNSVQITSKYLELVSSKVIVNVEEQRFKSDIHKKLLQELTL